MLYETMVTTLFYLLTFLEELRKFSNTYSVITAVELQGHNHPLSILSISLDLTLYSS